jgi:hypothetical protein
MIVQISLRFLCIILRVIRLEVSVYSYKPIFKLCSREWGGGVTVIARRKILKTFVLIASKNSVPVLHPLHASISRLPPVGFVGPGTEPGVRPAS